MKLQFLLGAIAVISFGVVVHSQEPGQTPASTAPTTSGTSGSVDNQGVKNYLLGPGDVVDVRVFGQPDLNAVAEVDSDGNISSLPFIEAPIPAKCRTEKQIQKDIAAAYSKFIKGPQISVRITERKSRQPAVVFGAVRAPTRLVMVRKVRLNEVMAASGGFTERASGTIQILHTEPVMCPDPGEVVSTEPFDPTKVPLEVVKIADLKSGRVDANPFIRPGDYIMVTEAEPVYITGSVMSPQGVFMRDQLTLSLAIGMVGGLRKEAKGSDIRIYRQRPGSKEQELIKADLNAIKKNQKPDILLQPYDVVEVGEAGLFSPGRLPTTLMSGISGAFQSMTTTVPTRILY
ncbi:MAG TPA: polysaccharide biosynthesis/export family protein [Pyrinomonadaceae bacterium]|nr:polysaccharide biosynthesis/export family protein [Pyrinomonadaceae bacterium]